MKRGRLALPTEAEGNPDVIRVLVVSHESSKSSFERSIARVQEPAI